jgi:hypothetical protein
VSGSTRRKDVEREMARMIVRVRVRSVDGDIVGLVTRWRIIFGGD